MRSELTAQLVETGGDESRNGFRFKPPWQRYSFAAPGSAVAIAILLFCSGFIRPTRPVRRKTSAIEVHLIHEPGPKPAGLQGGSTTAPHKIPRPRRVAPRRAAIHPHKIVEAPRPSQPAVTTSVGGSIAIPKPPTTAAKASPGAGVGVPKTSGVGSALGLGADSVGARALYAPLPIIPDDLRETDFRAVAVAKFKVLADGTATVVLIKATPSPRLNEVVLTALRRWRFFPAMRDGNAVDSEFEVRIPISVQ